MPYIDKDARPPLISASKRPAKTAGELNYQITLLLVDYVEANGGLSYARINDVVGACEGAKLEFYRRVAVPYEDSKINLNGDVYPANLIGWPDKESGTAQVNGPGGPRGDIG